MSSSPTELTSTTGSSISSPSRTESTAPAESTSETESTAPAETAIIACGAISQPIAQVVARRGWSVDIHPLPPLLHNHPERIAGAVEPLIARLRNRYASVAIGYADCGTYGALDDLCDRYGVRRLDGLHCYDLYGGADRMREMFDRQPGTYVLTDFLVRSFERTVVRELGLDRYPDLHDVYFQHYRRVVWLAQAPDDELHALATRAADVLGLPLTVLDVGLSGLEHSMENLLGLTVTAPGHRVPS